MTFLAPKTGLTIHLSDSQLGFLAYLYPKDDPEQAIVKLLERDRLRSLRRAEQNIEVLHRQSEREPEPQALEPVPEIAVPIGAENPIGALQEYCQQKQLPLPSYSFEAVDDSFCCTVEALGLSASATASTKKKAKAEAAAGLLRLLGQVQGYSEIEP